MDRSYWSSGILSPEARKFLWYASTNRSALALEEEYGLEV